MNHLYCHSHKKILYELIYGDKLWEGFTLIEELFNKNIYDEESISKIIKIKDLEDIVENLNDDIIYGQSINFNKQLFNQSRTSSRFIIIYKFIRSFFMRMTIWMIHR